MKQLKIIKTDGNKGPSICNIFGRGSCICIQHIFLKLNDVTLAQFTSQRRQFTYMQTQFLRFLFAVRELLSRSVYFMCRNKFRFFRFAVPQLHVTSVYCLIISKEVKPSNHARRRDCGNSTQSTRTFHNSSTESRCVHIC